MSRPGPLRYLPSLDGLRATLDERYERSAPRLHVSPWVPAKSRTGRTVVAELFTGAGCPPCVAADIAFEAALEPDNGDWLYYVTVNLDTGETKFTSNYNEFLNYQQQLRDWEAANPQ